ncbi:MAG TPA: Ig-like domain-containing protein [Gemmatimonadota bacterium]|nr:Ig-like domain-containing protein [Gemmatimonadota bacterium]
MSVFVLLAFGATACEDDDGPTGPDGDDVAQVIIEFDDDTLTVGGTLQLTVTVIDEEGDTLSAQTVSWSSSNTAVASVSNTGLVEGLTAGSATITATVDEVSDTVTIVIEEDTEPANLTLDPGVDTNFAVGDTLTFTGTVTTAGGDTLAGQVVTFSSVETDVATVDPSTGLVTAVAVGRTQLVATSGALADTVEVSVGTLPGNNVGTLTLTPATLNLAVGASDTLAVAATDTLGAAITNPLVDFSSDATAVATVDAFGVVTGVATGTANIVATFGAASDTTAVTVP